MKFKPASVVNRPKIDLSHLKSSRYYIDYEKEEKGSEIDDERDKAWAELEKLDNNNKWYNFKTVYDFMCTFL